MPTEVEHVFRESPRLGGGLSLCCPGQRHSVGPAPGWMEGSARHLSTVALMAFSLCLHFRLSLQISLSKIGVWW